MCVVALVFLTSHFDYIYSLKTPSDVSPFLPSDWEDIKESKVIAFQVSFEQVSDVLKSRRYNTVHEINFLAISQYR